jgi:hypothetical protein
LAVHADRFSVLRRFECSPGRTGNQRLWKDNSFKEGTSSPKNGPLIM